MNDKCVHCEHGNAPCGALSSGADNGGRSLICTKEEGHTGDHMACGLTMHEIATWNKENDHE